MTHSAPQNLNLKLVVPLACPFPRLLPHLEGPDGPRPRLIVLDLDNTIRAQLSQQSK